MTPRVRRTFWALAAIAVVAAGGLSEGLAATSGPVAGLAVAASGSLFTISLLLAVRILVVLGRRQR